MKRIRGSQMKASIPSYTARTAGAAFVFACTVQAIHWPFLQKPGTTFEWWQVQWMARLGEFVGFPVLGAMFPLARLGLPSTSSSIALHMLAVVWSLCVFWLAGRIRKKAPTQAISEAQPKPQK